MGRGLICGAVWLACVGCGDAPESDAGDIHVVPVPLAAAPSVGGITLVAPGSVYAGEVHRFEVTGAHPDERVYFLRGRPGIDVGPCYSFLGNACMGVGAPVILATVGHADGSGVAAFDLFVPGLYGGSSFGVQALVVRGLFGIDTVLSDPVDFTTVPRDTDGDGDPDHNDPCPDDNPNDTDGDGICDTEDSDVDGDGVDNASDPDPDDPGVCGDADGDTCDDCSAAELEDADSNGICDDGELVVPPPPAGCAPEPVNLLGSGDTCKTILDDDPSAVSGYYRVDPDGAGGTSPFVAYCQMTVQGGGWMLYASHRDDGRSIEAQHPIRVGAGCFGVFGDEQWVAARDAMTDGMMFIDDVNRVSRVSATALRTGNCRSIDQSTTLLPTNPGYHVHLWHHEADCNGTGLDYSLIQLSEVTGWGASVYQLAPAAPFDLWPYTGGYSFEQHSELSYYVR